MRRLLERLLMIGLLMSTIILVVSGAPVTMSSNSSGPEVIKINSHPYFGRCKYGQVTVYLGIFKVANDGDNMWNYYVIRIVVQAVPFGRIAHIRVVAFPDVACPRRRVPYFYWRLIGYAPHATPGSSKISKSHTSALSASVSFVVFPDPRICAAIKHSQVDTVSFSYAIPDMIIEDFSDFRFQLACWEVDINEGAELSDNYIHYCLGENTFYGEFVVIVRVEEGCYNHIIWSVKVLFSNSVCTRWDEVLLEHVNELR